MGELSALVERVEKLSGPDREVDAAIAKHFRLKQITWRWPDWCIDPPFTSSLDATIALVERVLPGWAWNASDGDDHGPWSAVFERNDKNLPAHMAATPAIALILALLKALQAREGNDG